MILNLEQHYPGNVFLIIYHTLFHILGILLGNKNVRYIKKLHKFWKCFCTEA